MKIHWFSKKYLDIAVDRTTWLEMLKALSSRGHAVTLVTTYKENKIEWQGPGKVVYMATIKAKWLNHVTFLLSSWFYLWHIVMAERPDVIIMDQHTSLASIPLIVLARLGIVHTRFLLDIRTVPVETSSLTGWLEQVLFRLSIRLAKHLAGGITVISPAMRDLLVKGFNLPVDKVGIWSSGVSLTHFDPKNIPQDMLRQLRRKLDIDKKFVVLYHGSISMNRGLLEMVEACDIAKKTCADLCLVIIGDGEARERLLERVHSLNLESSFRQLNVVPYEEMPLYISLANIGILPFPDLEWWRVSSPLKLLEYLAMEKPVVATDIEAHRLVLSNSHVGFFAASSNPKALASAIIKAYETSDGQLKKLGAMGRDLVARQYTWEKQAEKLEAFLFG